MRSFGSVGDDEPMVDDPTLAGGAGTVAFSLGWRLAELYDSKGLSGPLKRDLELPDHLPGVGEMSSREKALALIAHIDADLHAVGTAVGATLPSADGIRIAMLAPGHQRDTVLRPIYVLYLSVRDQLAGTSPIAATSFGLGRMLADTALLPTKDTPAVFSQQFERFRLENAYRWLDDLDAAFPPRSASAVRASLTAWGEWVGANSTNGRIESRHFDAYLIRRLQRQGDMWRRLLTGEKAAETLPDAKAYRDAATEMLRNTRRMFFRFLWKWSLIALIAVAAAAGAIMLSVTHAPAGTDRLTSVVISVAGFLGVSWTGIAATFGRVMRKAEQSLWEAEVEAAIGRAATVQPHTKSDWAEPSTAEELEEESAPPAARTSSQVRTRPSRNGRAPR
ncbi:hypothetical protein GALL_233460 [mine drainage metagenome]|uniref:Uncharacterized protein n=1 Tax=mine drainage metagenome TaxID=410659 RepID=A0A1J5RF00_9ZZZZ